VADGTAFQIDVGVQAGGVASAADSLDALTQRLTDAGAASTAAASAVKAGEAAYRSAEASADRAARALEKIGIAAEAQRGKMKAAMDAGDGAAFWRAAAAAEKLNAQQSEAASKAASTSAALKSEAAALDKLKAAAGAAADNESKLSKAAKSQADAAKAAAKSQGEASKAQEGGAFNARALSSALGHLGGPLGTVGQQSVGLVGVFQKLTKSLGAAGVYLGIAVAITAIAAAAAVGTLAIAKWGVGLADAARTQSLLTAGVARSVKGGTELEASIDALGSKVPLSNEELLSMAGTLADTGLRGKDLSAALETAAVKAAKLKFGPDFAKQMLSLDFQASRLKNNIAGVFGGLKIEGLLGGISKLIALFDSTSVTGNAIKVLFESLFQPLVDGVTGFIPKVVTAFIQFEILVMKSAIKIKPFASKFELIGEACALMAAAVGVAIGLVVGLLVAAVAIVALTVAGFLWLENAGVRLGTALRGLWTAISDGAAAGFNWLQNAASDAVEFLKSISLVEIGTAMIDGLVSGVTGSAGKILGAMTGAVGGAVDGAKKLLGIASPSKVFAEIGMQTGAGMAQGVEGSTGAVQGSLENMVAPPEASAGGGAKSSGGGGSGLDLSVATFNFYGVEGAEDAEGRIGALLTRLLEGDVSQLGGSAVPNA